MQVFLTQSQCHELFEFGVFLGHRFPTAPGPFLYSMYGQGDLTQAFCRCAAVYGALQVLVCPYTFLMCALHENG